MEFPRLKSELVFRLLGHSGGDPLIEIRLINFREWGIAQCFGISGGFVTLFCLFYSPQSGPWGSYDGEAEEALLDERKRCRRPQCRAEG
jgi:hypothetical protein